MPPEKERTGGMVLDMDADRRAKGSRNRCRIERLQPPEPGGRQVAGDAAHAEAVGPVRRHLDIEDGVAETRIARIGHSERGVETVDLMAQVSTASTPVVSGCTL